jgi:hypothetical protein
MRGETVQVQHVTPDTVNAEERWKISKRLQRNDRIHLCWQRLVPSEELCQPCDREATGQRIDGEASAVLSLDCGE